MTSGDQPAPRPSVARWCCEGGSGSQVRAGFKPRRKQMVLRPTTACAVSPAQLPPCGVAVRAILRGLLATQHSPLATAFLIYGTGIRNRAKPLKTLDRDPF
jgi:hypothetical protein